MSEIKKVGVLGGGLMGSGIAQVSAMAGFETIVREVSEPIIQKSRARASTRSRERDRSGKVTAESNATQHCRSFRWTTELADLAECDIVIEAVVEDLELKNAMWKDLKRCLRAQRQFLLRTHRG